MSAIQLLPVIFTVIAALAAGFALYRSRYRESTDLEREKYIAALEARNKFLEEANQRQAEEQDRLKAKVNRLEGKVATLQDVLLRQCKHADIDPTTGGCRNCALGMAYGQGGRQ